MWIVTFNFGENDMEIFGPLKETHPLVEKDSKTRCAICYKKFYAYQRITLIPIPQTQKGNTSQAIAAHATCVYRGIDTPVGIIERIKDGDGSPFPVLLMNGKQATLKECGITGG